MKFDIVKTLKGSGAGTVVATRPSKEAADRAAERFTFAEKDGGASYEVRQDGYSRSPSIMHKPVLGR